MTWRRRKKARKGTRTSRVKGAVMTTRKAMLRTPT